MKSQDLPVYQHKHKILEKLQQHQAIVVESPTGSGKTTQLPQILYEAGYLKGGIIGVTQPRRIAAVSVSEFIAKQMKKRMPDTIGFKMRFEDNTDERTKIKIMTDGILLQEIKTDYFLSKYSVIIVDEAHERSLNIDFILGLLKRILQQRQDFKVIISSATINAEIFSEYFEACPIVNIYAENYPVEVRYTPLEKENDYNQLLQRIEDIVKTEVESERKGDILIFLPGQKAIKNCISQLSALAVARKLHILPLYSRLSSEEQERVFLDFPGKRKVIVATNIAETSVTIDGITVVIDSGLAKFNFYNQRTFTSSLIEGTISKASANQRRGRAGRTQPGICYRLYSRTDYNNRPLFAQEEIFRTDLSEVVLRMAEIGIKDFESFDFISPPERDGVLSAIETLKMLDALDDNRELTEVGKMMIYFPLLPKHSAIIIEAIRTYPEVLEDTLVAASFLSTSSPFLLPQGLELEARKAHHTFRDPYGDFMSYLKLFRMYSNSQKKGDFCQRFFLDEESMEEILNIKNQLQDIVSEMGIPISAGNKNMHDYLCCVAKGLIQFVCMRTGQGVFKTLTASRIQIHPGSVMFRENPDFIVAGEIVKTTRMYARSVSQLQRAWLADISPYLVRGFLGRGARRERLKERERDYTNFLKLGSEVFKIIREKRHKIVILPWEDLKKVINKLDFALVPDYKNMRAKIIYNGLEVLPGMKLLTVLKVIKKIPFEKGILTSWSQKNYRVPATIAALEKDLEFILCLAKRKKKQRELGFLTLITDGNGTYWLKSSKSFHAAMSETLASLENLADETADLDLPHFKERVSASYRKLTDML